MPTDLHELLASAAAAPPPAFDAEAVVDRGLRQRRLRTWAQAGAAVLLLAVAAGAVATSLPRTRVDLVGPGAAPSLPLALRYEEDRYEGGEFRRFTGEIAMAGWNDWISVTGVADPTAYRATTDVFVQRWTVDNRYFSGEVLRGAAAEPFEWLEGAASAPLAQDDSHNDEDEIPPSALLHPRFGHEPEERADRTILEEDLPRLQAQIAERLALDVDTLESVRYEHDACAADCGIQRHTLVWIPELELPLYVDELDPSGDRFTMRVTHLRQGIAPPPPPS